MIANENEGGIVLSLFLMVASITYAVYASVTVCVNNKEKVEDCNESTIQTRVRTLCACANIGNSVVHLLLIIYTKVNEDSNEPYWVKERELDADGIGGLLGLTILNFVAGMCSLHRVYLSFPLVWNSFVIVAGTFIPIVWLRFLEEGLSTWPYFIILIWFSIFSAELSAFSTALTYRLITPKPAKKKKD